MKIFMKETSKFHTSVFREFSWKITPCSRIRQVEDCQLVD